MADERELTRSELKERLAAAEARATITPEAMIEMINARVKEALAAQAPATSDPVTARLQRELDEARAQIAHLTPAGMPTNYVHYRGHVQALQDWWEPFGGYHFGPKEKTPGEVSFIDTNEYWPGCPFIPVLVKGQREDGLPKVEPHPDFPRS